MKEKTLVSTMTLITSLIGYFYAKQAEKDPVPIVMVSGFLGAMLGETLFQAISDKDNDDNNQNPPPSILAVT